MSSSRKPESTLRSAIINALNARGAQARAIHSDAFGFGFLDILCCYRGRFVYLEVKTPDNEKGPTLLQRHEMKKFSEAGALVRCVRSIDAALEVLDFVQRQHGMRVPEHMQAETLLEDVERGCLFPDEPMRIQTKSNPVRRKR